MIEINFGAPVQSDYISYWALDESSGINAADFGEMLTAGKNKIQSISSAKPGDKTLLDVLIPAEDSYQGALQAGDSFDVCLDKMTQAAEEGRDTTKDMVAKVGRSSRLGERSKGVIDAGAASCCLILQTFSVTIKENLCDFNNLLEKE